MSSPHRNQHRIFFGSTVLLLATTILLILQLSSSFVVASNQRVLLKDVSAITLSNTAMTTGRRSSPVRQMQCVGGPCKYAPSTVLCTNAGFDGADVLWKCKADLEKGLKLGDVTVSCEGYDYPDDPYILRGSCGLEYTLTGQAEVEKQQHHRYQTGHAYDARQQYQQQQQYHNDKSHHSHDEDTPMPFLGKLFMWSVVGIIVLVLLKACMAGGGAARGGGGGGGGSDGFPPPHVPGGIPTPFNSGFSGSYKSAPSTTSTSASASSGPGFWTGAAVGAAGGYLMGRRNAGSSSTHQQPAVHQPSYSSGSSSWGSSSPSYSGPTSLGTSSSSAFGGTKRR